jgi:hypothetical protein
MGVPGRFEIRASFLFPVSMLIRDDLPTLDRPITANSGMHGGGHAFKVTALPTYVAEFTFVNKDAAYALCSDLGGLRVLDSPCKAGSNFSDPGCKKSSEASKSSSPC